MSFDKSMEIEAGRGPVTHTCNPSYSGGKDQEDQGSRPAWANSAQDLILKKTHHKKTGLAECLPSKHEALSSNSSPTNKYMCVCVCVCVPWVQSPTPQKFRIIYIYKSWSQEKVFFCKTFINTWWMHRRLQTRYISGCRSSSETLGKCFGFIKWHQVWRSFSAGSDTQ
jgi:hypothetical protein